MKDFLKTNEGKIIVSACLAGLNCRYDGSAKPCEKVIQLVAKGRAVPVCPEQLGGLPIPRQSSERVGERVLRKDGADVTAEFFRGAEESLKLAKMIGATQAILKSRSPSCGCNQIYDGTFSGTLIPGDGVFTALCKASGIAVITEEEL
ncbi:MAG: DUF523 domain-containing protein [Anaerolinea sp.]|nr:DUF523 domain-containing protein [Anaerolinea sp.]